MHLVDFPSKNDISSCFGFINKIQNKRMQRYFKNYREKLLIIREETLVKYQKFGQADWREYFEDEVFELPFYLSNTTLYFHFSIEKLQRFEQYAIKDEISPCDLLSPNSNVLCSLSNVDNFHSRITLERPLYLASLPDSKARAVLVDGNHRLLYAIDRHIPFIEVLWFPPEITVHSLRDDFEKTFYRFIIDAYLYGQTGEVVMW